MLSVNPKVDLPFVNVPEVIMVILTLIVSEILVVPILVVPMQSVKTIEMLLYVDAHLIMLAILMFPAHLIPVLKIPVALIPSVLSVVKDLSVDVFEDSLEVQTAGKINNFLKKRNVIEYFFVKSFFENLFSTQFNETILKSKEF